MRTSSSAVSPASRSATSTPLTERSALALAAAIRDGETSAREVVEAHITLLERVNPRVNAVVAPRLEQARSEADAADARVGDGGETPPFLGVPCTIKESIQVAGMPNASGLKLRKDFRAEKTAPAAQRLIDAGAIPLGLTNTSEATLWIESHNLLYGRSHNPYDPRRTVGGSSGGEGASVGAGIAPFGLGSDIGGSIRIPAFCCGVFGHKPSLGLVPLTGMWPVAAEGAARRLLVNGPLTRRAEDLMPLLRVLSGPDPTDSLTEDGPELKDPAGVDISGMRVVLGDRALLGRVSLELLAVRERAAGALAAAGAKVEQVPMADLRRAMELFLAVMETGAELTLAEMLEAEGRDPFTWRSLLRRGEHTLALRLTLGAERLVGRMPKGRNQKLVGAAGAFGRELADMVGDGVILQPPLPRPAPRHGRTVGRPWMLWGAAIFNLAEFPVTEVPLGISPNRAPLGTQVAAAPGNDHVTIAVALELERVFGGWVPPERVG